MNDVIITNVMNRYFSLYAARTNTCK